MIQIVVGTIFCLLSIFLLGIYLGCDKPKYFFYGGICLLIGLAIRVVSWSDIEFKITEYAILDILIAIILSVGVLFIGFFLGVLFYRVFLGKKKK